MGPFGLSWAMFILYLIAVPGMIILSWVFPETKWWKKLEDEFFSWNTEDTEK